MYKDWWSNTKNCLGKNWFSIFVFVYLIIASVFVYCKGVESFSSETLIVSFVGILATFIVVNNYSQVRDIKEDFTKKIKELNYNNEKIEYFLYKTINSTEEYNFVLKLLKREDIEIEVLVEDKKTKDFIHLKCSYKDILFENDKFYLLKDMRKEEITTFLNYTNKGGFITVDSDFIEFYKKVKNLNILKNK